MYATIEHLDTQGWMRDKSQSSKTMTLRMSFDETKKQERSVGADDVVSRETELFPAAF